MRNRFWRLWHSVRLTLARGSRKKKAYSDKHNLFALFGEDVTFQPKTLPLYSELIKLHDGVTVGRNVEFVCHDVIQKNFNRSKSAGGVLRENWLYRGHGEFVHWQRGDCDVRRAYRREQHNRGRKRCREEHRAEFGLCRCSRQENWHFRRLCCETQGDGRRGFGCDCQAQPGTYRRGSKARMGSIRKKEQRVGAER